MPFAKQRRMVALFACLLTLPAVSTLAKAAEPTEEKRGEAKKHFRRGVELYEEQDFRAALAEFTRANELAPSYKVLYNIGQTQFQLQDYVKALESFDQYLERGGAEVAPPRRKEVEEIRTKLRARVATLDIRTNVDARIRVDDDAVGLGRSVTARVSAGPHVVTAHAAGYAVAKKSVTAAGEDQTRVELTLEPETTPSPAVAPSSALSAPRRPVVAAEPPREGSRTPTFVALSLTGVFATGTAVFGIAALSSKSSYDKTLASPVESRAAIDDARSRLRTTTVLADAFGVGALVAGVVTVVLIATRKTTSTTASLAPANAPAAPPSRPPVSFGLGLGPGFATAQGSF